jgi:CRISPR-associated protein Cmr3
MTAERWVVLEPLDTITVRDGRPFDAGQQSAARMALPNPGTLAGAIGAAYGALPGAGLDPAARGRDVPAQVIGPLVVRRHRDEWRVRWPVPCDVVREDDSSAPFRLVLSESAAGSGSVAEGVEHDLGSQVTALLTGQGDPAGGWWDTDELADYLISGETSGDTVDPPWEIERRVGLALEEPRAAAESMLYSAEHLRPLDGVGWAACCIGGPQTQLPGTVQLGGRGRTAQVHDAVAVPEFPAAPTTAPHGRLVLYLATPAVFANGWRPDLSAWPGTELVAAALGDPQVIASATPDRATGSVGRGRMMWAVPAGSVYYLQFVNEQAALAAAAELRRLPLRQARESLATAGFGFALTGNW